MIINFVSLISYCINTQSFVNDKTSCISQFINGKSRDLQNLRKSLSGIVTSSFKVGTGGHGGEFPSSAESGCAGLCDIFPIIFVLYPNDLPSIKHYGQHYQLCLYNNSINFLMS